MRWRETRRFLHLVDYMANTGQPGYPRNAAEVIEEHHVGRGDGKAPYNLPHSR